MASVRVGDVGTQLVVPVVDEAGEPVDVSGATRTIYLKKPGGSGAVLTKVAVNDTDGGDGLIRYDTVAGDLDRPGNWSIQGHVALTSGERWHTDEFEFHVADNLA